MCSKPIFCSKVAQKLRQDLLEVARTARTARTPKVAQTLPSTIGKGLMALDHSGLGLENKFLGNKPGRIFWVRQVYFTKSSQQIWGGGGGCKPTFYTFYTSHLRWNSTIYHTDLVQNAVFHKFSRQIALSQYTFRTIYPVLLAKPFKKFLKSPTRPAGSHFWQQKRQFAVRTVVKCLNEH